MAFGILWFFITLAVESSVIPISDVIYEHRLYLPSVGAFIAIAALAALVLRRYPPRALGIAAAVVVVILAAATWQRNLVWGDVLTFWTDNVEKAPRKFRPHSNLGKYLEDKGQVDDAIGHLLSAIKARPDHFESLNNLGVAYGMKGDADKAIEHLQAALRLKPDDPGSHTNLARAYDMKGLTTRAEEERLLAERFAKR